MTIKTSIIQIGNSQGIRIPKPLLESGLSGEVELEVANNTIVIQAVSRPRKDWDAAFASMAEQGDDVLTD
ncbi:MAG: AbrB/MazE/SpoVT family DNA-binding domain-containing protein [Rhodothermales bacterium]|nr:AbrB/MazE/SpoVT family DNA-binding domain-containing protein [Rhodothermales bacterium]